MQQNEHTKWLSEHPLKEPKDIDLLGQYMPAPVCGVTAVNETAAQYDILELGGVDASTTVISPNIFRGFVGHRVFLIGGFDQFHHFTGCTEAETRAAVRKCFAEAVPAGAIFSAPPAISSKLTSIFWPPSLTKPVAVFTRLAQSCTSHGSQHWKSILNGFDISPLFSIIQSDSD